MSVESYVSIALIAIGVAIAFLSGYLAGMRQGAKHLRAGLVRLHEAKRLWNESMQLLIDSEKNRRHIDDIVARSKAQWEGVSLKDVKALGDGDN